MSAPVPLAESFITSSSALVMPRATISCFVITCRGSALSFAMRLMLEPVTSTLSTFWASCC
ncbi:MAG: hypothetical protein IPJ28_07420 [Betaproteobacteria bacterium]|nr:hypothetical protein [Betaproteobacteria bacterium]